MVLISVSLNTAWPELKHKISACQNTLKSSTTHEGHEVPLKDLRAIPPLSLVFALLTEFLYEKISI